MARSRTGIFPARDHPGPSTSSTATITGPVAQFSRFGSRVPAERGSRGSAGPPAPERFVIGRAGRTLAHNLIHSLPHCFHDYRGLSNNIALYGEPAKLKQLSRRLFGRFFCQSSASSFICISNYAAAARRTLRRYRLIIIQSSICLNFSPRLKISVKPSHINATRSCSSNAGNGPGMCSVIKSKKKWACKEPEFINI